MNRWGLRLRRGLVPSPAFGGVDRAVLPVLQRATVLRPQDALLAAQQRVGRDVGDDIDDAPAAAPATKFSSYRFSLFRDVT
jgi:hypothetical protein